MVGMHDYFTASTQCPTGRSCDNRNGAVLEQLVSLLEAVNCCLYHLPLACLSTHENQHEVSACREVRCFIVNNHSAELLPTLFNGVAQHFNDTLVDGVHLGMELEASHAIT